MSHFRWVVVACLAGCASVGTRADKTGIYDRGNLVAWCIVPFDAKKRTPEQRAAMVSNLGIGKVAYDWRQQHIAEFEQEILAYKKYGLEYFAFWSWHPSMEPLIRKHGIRPQIWKTNPSPKAATQEARVAAAGKLMLPWAKKAVSLDCKLGLYNHGGWGGEPENLVAVCRWLRRETGSDQIGIVYNFHHGHGHIDRFAEAMKQMKPYLFCVNLNGMADPTSVKGHQNKILPIGSGVHEKQMMRVVLESGYRGPVGILGHVASEDVQVQLGKNLAGLGRIKASLKP